MKKTKKVSILVLKAESVTRKPAVESFCLRYPHLVGMGGANAQGAGTLCTKRVLQFIPSM